jgi:hypothetical protein
MEDNVPKVGIPVKVLGVLASAAVAYSYGHGAQGAKVLFYAEDMLAALLMFSVAYSLVAVMILILFLLDEILYRILAFAGLYVVHTELRLRRSRLHVTSRDLPLIRKVMPGLEEKQGDHTAGSSVI